jgi:microcystin-dependent protein
MSEPFIAEIRIFAGNFAPRGWAFCDGQTLQVAQNTALFSLVGTTYGGDGRTTFGIPDLKGRAPMHPGNGPGLASRRLGERGGAETATLTSEAQIGAHSHVQQATGAPAQVKTPGANLLAESPDEDAYAVPGPLATMSPDSTTPTGGNEPHNNMQPYLTLSFIIAITGVYPSRD